MNRSSPMRRTAFKAKPKKRASPKPLVPKALGKSRVGKLDYRRSQAHIELVKAQPCLVSRRLGPQYVAAHHPQECFPELTKQGGKISDFLCVPLAHELHDPGTPGSLHHANTAAWWGEKRVSPLRWLLHFLPRHYAPGTNQGADEALAQVRRRLEMNGGTT